MIKLDAYAEFADGAKYGTDGNETMPQEITLKDFEIRYTNIRKQCPKIENCSVKGCKNPVDITEGMGKDTSCAYHRILFDIWSCEYDTEMQSLDGFHKRLNQKARRCAFTKWRNKMGKEKCDNLVLKEAQCEINWVC